MKRQPVAGVPSPCIDVCRIDPATGWCAGCRRSLDEIAAWGTMTDAARRELLQELARRALPAARAGAALEPLR